MKTAEQLQQLCHDFRVSLIHILHAVQTGHPGGSLSACEIITTIYQNHIQVTPSDSKQINRDRFVLGKGHAAPMLYINLAEKGFFPEEDLAGLRQIHSHLQGHPCMLHTNGVDISTGPLGLGLSAAVGMALSMKLKNQQSYTYVILGDGELQEGIIWEAAMAASKYKLNNMIVFLDNNGVQLDGFTDDIMPLGDISLKWKAFGWEVIEIDGHDINQINRSIEQAKRVTDKPILINAKTIKGKGISFMENQNIWHGKPIDDNHYQQALHELGVK